jgi:hypothetical protein
MQTRRLNAVLTCYGLLILQSVQSARQLRPTLTCLVRQSLGRGEGHAWHASAVSMHTQWLQPDCPLPGAGASWPHLPNLERTASLPCPAVATACLRTRHPPLACAASPQTPRMAAAAWVWRPAGALRVRDCQRTRRGRAGWAPPAPPSSASRCRPRWCRSQQWLLSCPHPPGSRRGPPLPQPSQRTLPASRWWEDPLEAGMLRWVRLWQPAGPVHGLLGQRTMNTNPAGS